MNFRLAVIAALAIVPLARSAGAQTLPPDLDRERAAYTEWLATAPNSPMTALAQHPIGSGIRLGPPDSEVPLAGVGEHRVTEAGGAVALEGATGSRPLPVGRPVALGDFFVSVGGVRGRRVLTLYGPTREAKGPAYYGYDRTVVFTGPMQPPEQPGRVRVLALDGVEVDAVEAGTVSVPIGGRTVRLRVRRIPTGEEESELEIYFRDGTNGDGTYPAGRFVSLVRLPGGNYRLDFNRARNPFCAYSSAFPCPAPWRGNTIEARVEAGERYLGGGLSTPPDGVEAQ